MTQRFTVANICIDITAKLVFYALQLIFHLRLARTKDQKIAIAMMLIDRRTDTIGQQVGDLFTHQSSYKSKQGFLNIQTKLPADLLFVFKLPSLYFFGVVVLSNKIICIGIPHISINTVQYSRGLSLFIFKQTLQTVGHVI